MLANFHTHTYRCGHASGKEREYIEAAIKSGIKILGFSDHTPQIFDNGYVSGIRMSADAVIDYVETISSLKKEYEKDIKILLGFETEYYPKCFSRLLDLYKQIKPDYVILGQHASNNEYDGTFFVSPTSDENLLIQYVNQVIEGLDSDIFSYVAHPDVINFLGDDKTYVKYMSMLCEKAKEKNLPLEINFLGLADNRFYPSERFLRCAEAVGNEIIFGIDAHSADAILNCGETEKRAIELIKPFKLKLTDKIKNLYGETIK